MSTDYIPAALRRLVSQRAANRCEYCLLPEILDFPTHEIDHIVAQKHGGKTEADNLALSCTVCNRRKGSDLASIDPMTEEVVILFHPRRHIWSEHFQFDEAYISPLSASGRATANLLAFNTLERVEERRLFIALDIMNP